MEGAKFPSLVSMGLLNAVIRYKLSVEQIVNLIYFISPFVNM